MAKTNAQLISDCYASGGNPVVSLGGQYVSCSLPRRASGRAIVNRYMNADGFYNAVGDPRQGATGMPDAPDSPKWKPIFEKIAKFEADIKSEKAKYLRAIYESNIDKKRTSAETDLINKYLKNYATLERSLVEYKIQVGLLPTNTPLPPTAQDRMNQQVAANTQNAGQATSILPEGGAESSRTEYGSGFDKKKILIYGGVTLLVIGIIVAVVKMRKSQTV